MFATHRVLLATPGAYTPVVVPVAPDAFELAIQNPVPVAAVTGGLRVMFTVYAAPGAGDDVLGTAVTGFGYAPGVPFP